MARYGQRPENALKRANEFLEVGKSPRALETLYEVFRNKKWAYNCSESILEPIMFKYLDLCVELRKSHIAKEGLFQYRNMFQTVNVGSLENVIRGYLRSAEEKTELAREHSHQAVIDIDDLDNLPTPESILLRAVSGEGAQDRSDRTILTPWVKFLWESYCQCLELLRTNALVETLYHDIARMAYQFCLKYNRKTEFRKLCDKLRKHLEDIGKLAPQANNVSLTRPETQQYNLETRLIQLDYAIQMELWQEAYKATEDIHNLMTMSKKSPAPKTMANYYQKLALVFWKAGPAYYLYHAAALFKLFQLNKEMKKNITQEDLQRMASRVLLATLAIPLPSAHPEFDRFIETDKSPLEKAQKLAVLLTLNQPPTRSSLLKDLARYNVLNMASPPLQELYNLLEVNFNPLQLCSKVENIIEVLQDSDQYIPPLKDVTLVILIRQVSQVYETITYSRLLQLAHFATQFHMERLLMECVRQNDMQIRIDHGKGCIYFGADLSESQREDKLEGVIIQSMPSEQIRNQLVNMNDVLHRCLQIINPNYTKGDSEQIHRAMVQRYHEIKHHEHQRILARHKIIEKRKEYLEQMNTVREQEEAKKTEEIARQQAMAEQKRLEIEREERERKRQENELQQIKDRTLKEKMHQISLTAHGQKLLKTLQGDELKNLDADKIAVREAEELQKERKEQQQKLKLQEKKLDHFERAKRLEEIPLLKLAWKEKEEADRKFWHQQGLDKIQTMKQERKLALQHRDRLKRMEVDENAYLKELKNQRFSSYKEKIEQFEKELKEIRKERLEKRKRERIEKRKADYRKKLEEEAERKRQEEKREQEEEERKKREEEKAKERKIREELDRQSEQARKREEEAAKKYEAGGASGMGSRAPAASSDKAFWRGGRSADTKNDDKPMERKPRDSLRKPEEEGAKKPAKAAGGWRDKAKDEPAESSRSEGSRWKMDESRRRDDDEGIRRRDGDGNRRREDEGYRRRDDDGFRRKDDDGFRRKDDDSFRRKDDDGFRRKDEDGFRRKDDDSFRRKDDDSFRRKDDDSFRRKDDDSFRRKDDDGFRRKDDDGMRRKDDGNIRRRDDDSFTFRRREDDRKPDQETSWRSRNAPSERKTFSRDTDRDDRGPDNRERRFNSDKPARLESDDKDRGRSAFGSDRKSDGKGWRGAPSFPSRKPDDSKSWRQDHE